MLALKSLRLKNLIKADYLLHFMGRTFAKGAVRVVSLY